MGIWIWVILGGVVVIAGLALLLGRKREGRPMPVTGPTETGGQAPEGAATPGPGAAERGPADDNDGGDPAVEAEPELNFAFDGVAGVDRFGPAVLAAGSRISYGDTTYLVAGTGALKVADQIWYEHLLQGGEQPHWLSVENIDGHIRLGWWTNRVELGSDDSADELSVDGAEYRRIAEGDGVFAVSGRSGAVTQGEYRHVDLVTDDSEHLLRFETWGEEASPGASTGHFINYEDIEIHPPEPHP